LTDIHSSNHEKGWKYSLLWAQKEEETRGWGKSWLVSAPESSGENEKQVKRCAKLSSHEQWRDICYGNEECRFWSQTVWVKTWLCYFLVV
jgi:hypothetical protein